MHRAAASILIACFLGLGTGGLQFLHERQHAAEDAREELLARQSGKPAEPHDESKCELCNQLHMTVLLVRYAPLVIGMGVLVWLLTVLPHRWGGSVISLVLNCRGPPVLLAA